MRHNSVVSDITHGLIRFPHLTLQVKSAANETSTKLQTVPLRTSLHYHQ